MPTWIKHRRGAEGGGGGRSQMALLRDWPGGSSCLSSSEKVNRPQTRLDEQPRLTERSHTYTILATFEMTGPHVDLLRFLSLLRRAWPEWPRTPGNADYFPSLVGSVEPVDSPNDESLHTSRKLMIQPRLSENVLYSFGSRKLEEQWF